MNPTTSQCISPKTPQPEDGRKETTQQTQGERRMRVWSQHSGVRCERTTRCNTVWEKQQVEDGAYLVSTVETPDPKIYMYAYMHTHVY